MTAKPPLRAVVLDNDETTGSYGIVFAYLHSLEQVHDLNPELLCSILKRLADWMIMRNVFRPGLRSFLRCLLALRRQKKLDAIVMYTNQYDSGTIFSVPKAIAYMMNYLAGETVFDVILTRPEHPEQDGIYRKQFSRILDLFPGVPRDIRQVIFFDDHATRDFIGHQTIPLRCTEPNCWYKVEPYTKLLTQKDTYESILYSCYSFFGDEVNSLVNPIFQEYLRFVPDRTSTPSAVTLMTACITLQKKYGYVPKVLVAGNLNSTVSFEKDR